MFYYVFLIPIFMTWEKGAGAKKRQALIGDPNDTLELIIKSLKEG